MQTTEVDRGVHSFEGLSFSHLLYAFIYYYCYCINLPRICVYVVYCHFPPPILSSKKTALEITLSLKLCKKITPPRQNNETFIVIVLLHAYLYRWELIYLTGRRDYLFDLCIYVVRVVPGQYCSPIDLYPQNNVPGYGDGAKEDCSDLPPNQRKKRLQQRLDEIQAKIQQETAARDGLMKMKGVYEQNPALGDPMSIEGQLNQSSHKLDKLGAELTKFQGYLDEAMRAGVSLSRYVFFSV